MNAMTDPSLILTAVELKARPVVWIVVITKAGQEQRAKLELLRQGFEVYLPMRLAEGRKGELRSSPFFPRYLFAKLPADLKAWGCVFSTYGVTGVLGGSQSRPVGVVDAVVQGIKAREEAGYIKIGLAENQASKGFAQGQRVWEPEFGLEGAFSRAIDKDRAEILIQFMGRASVFTVDLKTLVSAEPEDL